MTGFWDDAEVISVYTRAQAIEDGVLVPLEDLVPDEPGFAKGLWKMPIALSSALADLVLPNEREQEVLQDLKGRLWDVFWMAAVEGRKSIDDRILFDVLFQCRGREGYKDGQQRVRLKAICGPGDDWEPVLTFMLGGED